MPLSLPSGPSQTPPPALADIAARFVQARRQGRALPDFPGVIPDDLETAYRVQDLAIAQWPDRVVGWKVGYIAPERRDHSGDERLLGPIFAAALWNATGGTTDIPVFDGGFAAVEAEYVLRLDADVPADQLHWTAEQAAQVPATLFVGVEVASSPLATINQLGPRVVISDFGNNNGLLLGPQVPDWTALDETALRAETWIESQCVGTGGATLLPGGLRAAFAFALARSARRGRPLRRGELIATGNATGIHDIAIGQQATIRFDGYGELHCRAVAA
ncbi:2-keto-4-pentenoate hydratase [Xanthomonas sp. A2111]|uniref:2-keto-4-pentenoate hydratase n=1 Tax=Xanthomonas hawaiiensis TaxID=3003247 RepID=A0ABU2I757_9XANT|nr:2-keto-4-pentenoate hydratase [Xanthomonas sp. A2111]MBO9828485.1 2-keto-4-pentenoate hydratase [Xanthomonas sp. A2111]MDS9993232.1 2-keto-4-pentenoate hydratase [Xanthomonas sp. A2111]